MLAVDQLLDDLLLNDDRLLTDDELMLLDDRDELLNDDELDDEDETEDWLLDELDEMLVDERLDKLELLELSSTIIMSIGTASLSTLTVWHITKPHPVPTTSFPDWSVVIETADWHPSPPSIPRLTVSDHVSPSSVESIKDAEDPPAYVIPFPSCLRHDISPIVLARTWL